jgi:hypothetical protein
MYGFTLLHLFLTYLLDRLCSLFLLLFDLLLSIGDPSVGMSFLDLFKVLHQLEGPFLFASFLVNSLFLVIIILIFRSGVTLLWALIRLFR